MIVSSMNASELVKEIMLDIPMVESKAKYLLEAHRRKAVKSKDKSYYHIFDYKSKRQNKWLIVINYTNGLATFKMIVYFLNEYGINAISLGTHNKLYWFSPHFLTRYNERFLKQDNCSKLDLIKRFITANNAGLAEIDANFQYIFCRFTEGIGLGKLEIIDYHHRIFHLRTFISNQMIFEDQQHIAEWAGEYYDIYGHKIKSFTGIKSI